MTFQRIVQSCQYAAVVAQRHGVTCQKSGLDSWLVCCFAGLKHFFLVREQYLASEHHRP